MNYYLKDKENIVLWDTDRTRLETTLKFKPELEDKTIYETEREIIELDGHFVFADEHKEEEAKKRQTESDEEKQARINAQLEKIKSDIDTAIALDNTDWLKELRTAYDKTINDVGKTPFVYERTRCPYCGSEKLTDKYDQQWCENCEAGKLDLQIYEETHDVTEDDTKEKEDEK